MEAIGKVLLVAGVVLLVLGALLVFVPGVGGWLGKLPGDIRIERPGVKVFIPITTSILLSILLSLVLYLVSKLR